MKPTILHGHTRPIKDINFSPDSSKVYSASVDRTIISWNIEKKEKQELFQHGAALNCFTISNCGRYLASGDATGNVYIWDAEKVEVIVNLEGNPLELVKSIFINSSVSSILISFSGRGKTSPSRIKCIDLKELLLTYSPKQENNLQEKDNEKKLYVLENEEDEKISSFKNDGLDSNNNIIDFNEYSNQSIYNALNQNNSNSNSNSKQESFNQKEKKKVKKQNSNTNQINHNLYSLQQSTTKIENKISFEKTNIIFNYLSSKSKFIKAIFIQMDKCVLAGKEDGNIELINSLNGEVLLEKQVHSDVMMDLDVCESLRFILTASIDGYCVLTSLDTFEILFKFYPENPTRNINCCRLVEIQNPFKECKKKVNIDDLFDNNLDDNDLLEDKFLKIRKNDKLPLAVFSGGQDSKLVTTTHKKEGGFEIIAHELLTGMQVLNLESHFGPVNSISCLLGSNTLASGSEDSSVRLYDLFGIIKEKNN